MVIFHSYVSLPEGKKPTSTIQQFQTATIDVQVSRLQDGTWLTSRWSDSTVHLLKGFVRELRTTLSAKIA
jgi:hypothetical protein